MSEVNTIPSDKSSHLNNGVNTTVKALSSHGRHIKSKVLGISYPIEGYERLQKSFARSSKGCTSLSDYVRWISLFYAGRGDYAKEHRKRIKSQVRPIRHCLRCDFKWVAKTEKQPLPVECPRCHSKNWNDENYHSFVPLWIRIKDEIVKNGTQTVEDLVKTIHAPINVIGHELQRKKDTFIRRGQSWDLLEKTEVGQ
jgi:phage FluMu protein Com